MWWRDNDSMELYFKNKNNDNNNNNTMSTRNYIPVSPSAMHGIATGSVASASPYFAFSSAALERPSATEDAALIISLKDTS